jgi:predicted ATPase
MAPLTLLTGVNSMGKSTVLQSLLLLRQSHMFGNMRQTGLILNGPLVSIGTADDALYENSNEGDLLSFELNTESGDSATWSFLYRTGDTAMPPNKVESADPLFKENLFSQDFFYLQAERIGPRTSSAIPGHEALKYNCIGNSGEFCAHFLSRHERSKIPIVGLGHPNETIPELRKQVESWITEISQRVQIHLFEYPEMNSVNMAFSFIWGGLTSKNFRATNVGFGITYSLPIFVAALASSPGSLLMVENPEAHLHPKGQILMGRFLALAAANGIQVIAETHSDHLLNGIRIAVKKGKLSPEQTAIHYFEHGPDTTHSSIVSPKLDVYGRFDQWPAGFFDEWEKGLSELL